jgi:signal transduction histidine kinase
MGADDPGILDEGSALEWLVGPEGLGRYRARIVGIAIVVEIIATGVLGALHQPKDFHPVEWPWLGISIGFVGLIITFNPRIRLSARQLYWLSLISVPATGLYIWSVGPQLSAAMSTIILMMGVAVFTAFRWKRAIVIGIEVGLSYGVVLARQPDNNLSIARWFLTMGLMTSGALIARWLLQFLPGLVASEKEARREAEVANAQLAAATSHKSEFLANMSHELRTPLNAIIGFADVLKQGFFGNLNSKQTEYVDDIESAGRHLLALINDILDLAKAEAGRLELSTSPCCLAEIVEAGTATARSAAADRRVELRVEFDPDDATIAVQTFEGDPHRLARAIASVVDNAVYFTPAGAHVRVTARRSEDNIAIAVADSGPGIHPIDHERIFAAFEHAGRGDRAGSGIGLALARRLLELHGGSLSLDSRPGQGSIFTLLIPAPMVAPSSADSAQTSTAGTPVHP